MITLFHIYTHTLPPSSHHTPSAAPNGKPHLNPEILGTKKLSNHAIASLHFDKRNGFLLWCVDQDRVYVPVARYPAVIRGTAATIVIYHLHGVLVNHPFNFFLCSQQRRYCLVNIAIRPSVHALRLHMFDVTKRQSS